MEDMLYTTQKIIFEYIVVNIMHECNTLCTGQNIHELMQLQGKRPALNSSITSSIYARMQ